MRNVENGTFGIFLAFLIKPDNIVLKQGHLLWKRLFFNAAKLQPILDKSLTIWLVESGKFYAKKSMQVKYIKMLKVIPMIQEVTNMLKI